MEYSLPDPTIKITASLLQSMVSHKLAVVEPEGIQFLKEASFGEIEAQLRRLFPEIFTHFDTLMEEYNEDLSSKFVFLPHWMVCTKNSRQLSIASGVTHPTGHILDLNTSTSRSGFKEQQLILSMLFLFLYSY